MTQKNRDRLRQLDDPKNVDALLLLPEILQKAAARQGIRPRDAALTVQTAVIIEMLLMVPTRIRRISA